MTDRNVLGERVPALRCPAEYHAHIDNECLGKLTQCNKDEGHTMRGWHRSDDDAVSWDFDHRESCPLNPNPLLAEWYDAFLKAIEQGFIQRRWECYSDKSDCHSPEESEKMGYLHDGCRWYFHLWTVEQGEIEDHYQMALAWKKQQDSRPRATDHLESRKDHMG